MVDRYRTVAVGVVAAALVSFGIAHAGRGPQLVVRYAPGVDAPSAAQRAGATTLGELHRRFGVQAAGPLVAASASRARVRDRFPQRTARRAAHAGSVDLSTVYVLDLAPGTDVAAAAAAFTHDAGVVWAEPVLERAASYLPDDPFLSSSGTWGLSYRDLWGLVQTGAPAAWDVAQGAGVVVAVVDTGILAKHRDLAPNIWKNPGEIPRNRVDDDGNGFVDDDAGWDFVRKTGKVKDKHGHGTHVAGTIAAAGDDALGVAGMAYRAQLMNLRALDERGTGHSTDLARAIVYAAENGADVINCSWGGFGISSLIADAVTAATDLGVVVVFAAGNDGRDGMLLGEANLPQVIAVAATTPTDNVAGFSNFGDAISVAAPGVDILSTRASASRVGGAKVGSRYLRLTGTSMAAPHVSGLAALLLSQDPSLTNDEVRWHLELNAHQLGYPGWEGQAWNPRVGWGRIDAARVFDPPPVTTRLRLRPAEVHAFAGTVTPDIATLRTRFTSTTPVSWSFAGAPWIQPASAAGGGDAQTSLAIDATGMSAGTVSGGAGVVAPAASDGGGSRALLAHLHEDARLGGPLLLTDASESFNHPPVVASNGSTTLVVWPQGVFRLNALTIAADGTVTGPFTLLDTLCVGAACWQYDALALDVASDGTSFLVAYRTYLDVWHGGSRDTRNEFIRTLRVDAAGHLLDAAPTDVFSQVQTFSHAQRNYDAYLTNVRVAWDGATWTVLSSTDRENGQQVDTSTVRLRRLSASNVPLAAAVQLYPTPSTALHQIVRPDIACVAPGDCLAGWIEFDGGDTAPGQLYVRNARGLRVRNGQPDATVPTVLLSNVIYNDLRALRVVASPSGYGLLTLRNSCASSVTTFCGYDLIGGLVTATGAPVDPAGFRLNQPPVGTAPLANVLGLAFDGTQFVAAFVDYAALGPFDYSEWREIIEVGSQIFAARFTPGGAVLDAEPIGRLVHPLPTALDGRIVSGASSSVVVWEDLRYPGPDRRRSYWAQRIFPH